MRTREAPGGGVQAMQEVVQSLMARKDGCPWLATQEARQLITFAQSELVETSAEIEAITDAARAGAPEAVVTAARDRLEAEISDVIFCVFLVAELCGRDLADLEVAGPLLSMDSCGERGARKLRRRCPYVFGTPTREPAPDCATAEAIWQRVKKQEKEEDKALQVSLAALTSPTAAAAAAPVALDEARDGDVVILVAKFPTLHKSKTRLIPALGPRGALEMAQALVQDALTAIATSPALREARCALLFAPATAEADFADLLERLGVQERWALIPMMQYEPGGGAKEMRNPDLGDKLAQGLADARALPAVSALAGSADLRSGMGNSSANELGGSRTPEVKRCRGVAAFLGMDSPELTPAHIATALATCRRRASAYMCPATDGGYTLLALPPATSSKIFRGFKWSSADTGIRQMSTIASRGVPVIVGPAFSDIDEVEDLQGLDQRLVTTADEGSGCPCPTVKACLERKRDQIQRAMPSTENHASSSVTRGPTPQPLISTPVAIVGGFVAGVACTALLLLRTRTTRP